MTARKAAQTEAEILIERETISAGHWPREAPAEITKALTEGNLEPTTENIAAVIAQRRSSNPEEFLNAREQHEANRGPDDGRRFVQSYKEVLRKRDKCGQMLRKQRDAISRLSTHRRTQ